MRPLAPRARRSARRAAYRRRYAGHIESPRWRQRRIDWLAAERRRLGADPTCAACGRRWTLRDDLHHATYERLGTERHADLVPTCRPCHEVLHAILERSSAWMAMPRPLATAGILARMQADRQQQH